MSDRTAAEINIGDIVQHRSMARDTFGRLWDVEITHAEDTTVGGRPSRALRWRLVDRDSTGDTGRVVLGAGEPVLVVRRAADTIRGDRP